MKDELMIEALLTEYREMRAEIRDTVNALDRNLYTGVVMISGLIALASLLHDSKILMFVPTIMLVVGFIHLAKTSSASILGT
ncbi:MAG: hypothetical protein L7F78_06610, partial [Syntrophales bacterium LBB04]|nr:hypothetical protein [Syntrophales bacterium LBB04]